MIKLKGLATVSLTLVVALVASLIFPSCKKSTTEPIDTSVPGNIFPLVPGRFIAYNGYLTQNDTESKITASESGYYTRWTLLGTVNLGPLGIAFAIKDSTSISGTDSSKSPKVLPGSAVGNRYVRIDSVAGEYQFLTNLGYFYRTFQIGRPDSLRWIKLAIPSKGIGGDWAAFTKEDFAGTLPGTQQAITVSLEITGKWVRKETIASAAAYLVEVSRRVTTGATLLSTGVTARVWVTEGVGPVQMHLFGDGESHGNYRSMTSKNF